MGRLTDRDLDFVAKRRVLSRRWRAACWVLIALIIMSVGMLGIASLQTMSLKSGHSAALRTVAVMKVDEILESMRSNPTGLPNYAAGTADMGTDNGCSQTGVAAPSSGDWCPPKPRLVLSMERTSPG